MKPENEDRAIKEALREASRSEASIRIRRMLKSIKPIAIIAFVGALAVGWFFRWETISVSNSNGITSGSFYMLNRWTGALYVVFQDERLVVNEFKGNDKPAK